MGEEGILLHIAHCTATSFSSAKRLEYSRQKGTARFQQHFILQLIPSTATSFPVLIEWLAAMEETIAAHLTFSKSLSD